MPASTRMRAARLSTSPLTRPHDRLKVDQQGRWPGHVRGLLKVARGAVHAKSFVRCLLDEHSRSNTYPSVEIDEEQTDIGHEATGYPTNRSLLADLMAGQPRGSPAQNSCARRPTTKRSTAMVAHHFGRTRAVCPNGPHWSSLHPEPDGQLPRPGQR